MQSHFEVAERRGIARDTAQGVNGDAEATVRFWHEWMAEELTFLADQRPWERACAVVAGTPPPGLGPDEVLLAPPPAPSPSRWAFVYRDARRAADEAALALVCGC